MDTQNPSAPPYARSRHAADRLPDRRHPQPRSGHGGLTHDNARHSARFTVIGNHLAQHAELSGLAIGLAVYIQSLPGGARVDIKTLTVRFPEGATRIAAALRELEAHGYLRRERHRIPGGRIITRTISCNQPGHHGGQVAAAPASSGSLASPEAEAPERYANPTKPDAPEQPDSPEAPCVPEQPDVPERPGSPEQPDAPEQPDVPERPDAPEQPDSPEAPCVPEQPDAGEQPDVPERPGSPEQPDAPEQPDSPEVPDAAEVQASPERQGSPEVPGAAEVPTKRTPGAPRKPLPAVPRPAYAAPALLQAATDLLAGLRRHDPALLLSACDTAHLAPGVAAWLERDVSPIAVRHALTSDLPPQGLRRPAALLAHRLIAELPPPAPYRPSTPEPPAARRYPLHNCDGCDRAFRTPEPGRCRDCRAGGGGARVPRRVSA